MLYLVYLAEFACYGIEKSKVADFAQKGKAPEIIIDEEACKKIVPDYHKKAKIGFLLGEDTAANGTEYYTIGNDYLKSLLTAGADLRFLDYDNVYSQVSQCQGLVLPGGFLAFRKIFICVRRKNYRKSVILLMRRHLSMQKLNCRHSVYVPELKLSEL